MMEKNIALPVDTVAEERIKLHWKDILAITIAIYKVFLPWILVIGGIYATLLLVFDLMF